jgi:ribosomal protein S19
MKMLTKLAIATSVALATMAAAEAAYAQSPRHDAVRTHQRRSEAMPNVVGQGYYEGDYDFNVDRNDKASSPYADGGL